MKSTTALMVHNKIDNLKAKAKDIYKKYRRAMATGLEGSRLWLRARTPLVD